ncbi:2-succinyl-6-hydroxy-2,4-cyclohexadiene-1-carboxylate synthase [Aquibacillus koreensis]|uniref:Putative 2-succinyl-6-hydroxy-2,4-cyclohexadiene-1-carboxylate synthase n=1 Tax=Aquibacillus koreensis TaxID=279446 RepID=A0A9X3WL67_9BACI|nr:2-succinyl-6-hydroxy-2,4-cyclohexadiene-1-carboxylate synthase [Aquibacillus koreensis]MCT2535850.1 2-succinyl-6-hydroxy-2,4-cyclohexadiene-1-carboxylate synthase [Aquibacillus koreensis]MDC3420306.1 2-succinyl-6-hydroxy-2,4-cyclohexadiene-1-carboxylate synthase [Aquibacillus koreensis]
MYYTLNNRKYWVQEQGNGNPIVLFHGFTGSSHTWDAFVESWKSDNRLILVDLPGHGKTELTDPVSMEEFCKDISQLLEKLSLPSAHFIGYSLGGRAALSFAMLYPEKVESLILESGSPGLQEVNEQVARQAKDEALALRLEKEGIEAFVRYWENIPLFESQKKLPEHHRQLIRQERLNQSEKGLAASLRGMGTGAQPSWWDQLPSLSVNVLLVVGQLDEKFIRIATKMAENLRYSHVKVISDAGHAVHVEQFEKFDTIVRDFMRSK